MSLFNIFKKNKPIERLTEEELLESDKQTLENFDREQCISNGYIKCIFADGEILYKHISEIDYSRPISINTLTKNNNKRVIRCLNKGYKYWVSTPICGCPFYLKENAEKYADKMAELLSNAKKSINQ